MRSKFADSAQVFTVHQTQYDHTQHGPLYLLIFTPSFALLLGAALLSHQPAAATVLVFSSFALACVAYSFRWLRVVDEGDHLGIRFGPLPLLRKRIPFAEIEAAVRDRTTVLDGWGIHWIPGRGWTYNLWGYDCVRLSLTRDRTIRIGTDDANGLIQFLNGRLQTR
jgi:hypothetical protein